jgi:hypothetical protein
LDVSLHAREREREREGVVGLHGWVREERGREREVKKSTPAFYLNLTEREKERERDKEREKERETMREIRRETRRETRRKEERDLPERLVRSPAHFIEISFIHDISPFNHQPMRERERERELKREIFKYREL